jgi:ribosome-binding factor A
LRGEIARRINLKFAPDVRFKSDPSFEASAKIDALLRSPEVQRDLDPHPDDSGTSE